MRLLRDARYRCRLSGATFDITLEQLGDLPTRCPVLGIPLKKGEGRVTPGSPSLDQIVPGLGYIPGNVAIISHRANRIKQDATYAELRAVSDWLERRMAFHGGDQ